MSNAFEQYAQLEGQDQKTRTIRHNVEERHYLWTFGDSIPHREVAGGMIERGQVTPILRLPQWDRLDDVPETMRVDVRIDPRDPNNRVAEAKYYLPPEPIFRGIMADYESWGLTDLTAVTDWDAKTVWELRIAETFFPDGIPETYDAVAEHLKSVNLPGDKVWEALRLDLLRAVQNARRADMALVDYNEECIEKSKTQPGYIGVYTEQSDRAMARLGRTRKDLALTRMAVRQNVIEESLPDLIKTIAANQGTALSPEHLMEFAKALGSQITEGVKEAIAAAATSKPAAPPATQNTQRQPNR